MMFRTEHLTIRHQSGTVLLADFNLTIAAGEIVSLMGPSGCGKSTLLNVIAGHLSADFRYHGKMQLNGVTIDTLPPHQRHIGMLFQDDLLFPHLNVWENLAFALPDHIKGSERKQQALQALGHVQLGSLAPSFPQQISGGQRARISLIRMLLARPQLALLDEPFNKLDKALRGQFRDWVFERLQTAGIPTLMVTHDPEDVLPDGRIIHWPTENSHA
ncbi:ATP-binding cassette domain-containing protein [Vibrio sp. H11]|uniref:ATP-binding cassette domain-containing protein n=1 Tax=Vibrio sp. H11 TaxID=2565928 RepID=UPI0010A6A0B4|nr:ATP-binding cassette domain-containing protein [Vibrio sp. H11]